MRSGDFVLKEWFLKAGMQGCVSASLFLKPINNYICSTSRFKSNQRTNFSNH